VTETDLEPDSEPDLELDPDPEPVPETDLEPEPKTKLKIETLDDMKRVLIIARGGDPDAIQAVANFMDLKNPQERTYFPDKTTAIAMAQLEGFGKLYFPKEEWNPFSLVAEVVSVSLMGYKGFKSNQFVDMTRQTPNLSDLQTIADNQDSGGLLSRFRGGSKTE